MPGSCFNATRKEAATRQSPEFSLTQTLECLNNEPSSTLLPPLQGTFCPPPFPAPTGASTAPSSMDVVNYSLQTANIILDHILCLDHDTLPIPMEELLPGPAII